VFVGAAIVFVASSRSCAAAEITQTAGRRASGAHWRLIARFDAM